MNKKIRYHFMEILPESRVHGSYEYPISKESEEVLKNSEQEFQLENPINHLDIVYSTIISLPKSPDTQRQRIIKQIVWESVGRYVVNEVKQNIIYMYQNSMGGMCAVLVYK